MNFGNDKPLTAILIGSVLMNAFLIGFAISHFARDDDGGPHFGAMGRDGMAHDGARFGMNRDHMPPPPFGPDDDTRSILDRAFAPQRDEIDKAMDEMEANKMQIEGLLAAETLDKAAFEAALTKMQAANAAAFGGLEKSLRTAASMSLDDRKALVEALGRLPAPGPQGPRWMRTPGGPGK